MLIILLNVFHMIKIQEATKKAQEKAAERLRSLEEDLAKSK